MVQECAHLYENGRKCRRIPKRGQPLCPAHRSPRRRRSPLEENEAFMEEIFAFAERLKAMALDDLLLRHRRNAGQYPRPRRPALLSPRPHGLLPRHIRHHRHRGSHRRHRHRPPRSLRGGSNCSRSTNASRGRTKPSLTRSVHPDPPGRVLPCGMARSLHPATHRATASLPRKQPTTFSRATPGSHRQHDKYFGFISSDNFNHAIKYLTVAGFQPASIDNKTQYQPATIVKSNA
jgi:hypothetical protein